MRAAFSTSKEDLADLLSDEPRYRTEQVWRGLWERGARPAEMTDLPRPLRERLEAALVPSLREVSRSASSDGQTTKWLWALADERRVETVLMLYPDRATVCVSSQAGCAMGCTFCATGQGGFDRHLSRGRDRRASGARSPGGAPPAARQRGLHGHGRASSQLRTGVGRGAAHPLRPRYIGSRI